MIGKLLIMQLRIVQLTVTDADILETWNCGWAAQGWVLWLVCTIFRCLGNPHGITAIDPLRYAWRFDEFVQDKILDISDHDTDMNGEPTGDMNPLVYDGWRDQESQSWRPWK